MGHVTTFQRRTSLNRTRCGKLLVYKSFTPTAVLLSHPGCPNSHFDAQRVTRYLIVPFPFTYISLTTQLSTCRFPPKRKDWNTSNKWRSTCTCKRLERVCLFIYTESCVRGETLRRATVFVAAQSAISTTGEHLSSVVSLPLSLLF